MTLLVSLLIASPVLIVTSAAALHARSTGRR